MAFNLEELRRFIALCDPMRPLDAGDPLYVPFDEGTPVRGSAGQSSTDILQRLVYLKDETRQLFTGLVGSMRPCSQAGKTKCSGSTLPNNCARSRSSRNAEKAISLIGNPWAFAQARVTSCNCVTGCPKNGIPQATQRPS